MAIELSNLTFTDENDIVSASGHEQIVNTEIAHTLDGNDEITGSSYDDYGFKNVGTLNTNDGNHTIIGHVDFSQSAPNNYGIFNSGTLNIGEGDDVIIGSSSGRGIYSPQGSIFDTRDSNDLIMTGRNSIGNGSNTFTTSRITFPPITISDPDLLNYLAMNFHKFSIYVVL
jgi:hypothetical protein